MQVIVLPPRIPVTLQDGSIDGAIRKKLLGFITLTAAIAIPSEPPHRH
jgi:hypothetical protein